MSKKKSKAGNGKFTRKEYDKELRKLQAERGLSYLFISHDLKVVRALCHRVIVMQHGNIAEEGLVEDVLSNPKTEYTSKLVRAAFEVAA